MAMRLAIGLLEIEPVSNITLMFPVLSPVITCFAPKNNDLCSPAPVADFTPPVVRLVSCDLGGVKHADCDRSGPTVQAAGTHFVT